MPLAESLAIPKRQTVVEAIAQALIHYIASNGLKGGDRLPSERELVEMVGASRLPLREALCVLKGLGVVESRHGKGIFVKHLDVAAIFGMLSPLLKTQSSIHPADILQVRLHLEPPIAQLAAQARGQEHLDALHAHLAAMRQQVDDLPRFIQSDMAFHQELAMATGNAIFHVFMASLTDLLRELQFLFPRLREAREVSIQYHQRILEALENRDPATARATMEEHLCHIGENL